MPDLSCTISTAELHLLAQHIEVTPTAISPLRSASAGSTDTTHLQSAGLLTGGALAPAAREALEVLARASAYAGLVLVGDTTWEQVTYLDGTRRVALSREGDALRLESPAPPVDALLRGVFGDGDTNEAELDSVFTGAQAVVLAALIDLQRRHDLQGILDDREAGASPIPVEDVHAWVGRDGDSSQWLAPMVRDTVGVTLDAAAVDDALAALTAEDAVTREGDRIVPSPMIVGLAGRLLVLGMLARVRAGRATGEDVTTVDVRIARGLGGQHFLWEADRRGQVHLLCLPATDLVALLTPLLEAPEAITLD